MLANKEMRVMICLSTRNGGEAMTEKQKKVLERMSKAIEPLNDDQLDDLLKIGDGMIIMQDIMTRTRNKEAS